MATKQVPAVERPSAASRAPQRPQAVPPAQVPAVVGSRAVALPADLEAELGEAAKEAAAKERPSVSKMSLRGGVLTYMGAQMPNNQVDMVLLAYAFRRAFYSQAYNPNQIVNPDCFAINLDGEDMAPHENVSEPEHEKCEGCPRDEWGSTLRAGGGRGKACSETRRLIAIPAEAVEDIEKVKRAEMAVIDVPVTSVKNYAAYVNSLSAAVQRPMWAVVTRLQVVADQRTQFKLNFTPMEALADPDVIRAIKARLEDAQRVATQPWDESFLAEKNQPQTVQGPQSRKFAAKK